MKKITKKIGKAYTKIQILRKLIEMDVDGEIAKYGFDMKKKPKLSLKNFLQSKC